MDLHLLDISSLTTRTNTFLTVLPGTYYVSVQAIDGGNMGGPFSDEVSSYCRLRLESYKD